MTLPDLLEQAARLMPERFKWTGTRSAQVNYRGETRMFAHTGTHAELVWLEAACREECEARRWNFNLYMAQTATVELFTGRWLHDQRTFEASIFGSAPTPAEALLSALIQAVEGERV